MLLLTDQSSYYNKDLCFKMLGHQAVIRLTNGKHGVDVSCSLSDKHNISLLLPNTRMSIAKQIGGWLGFLIREKEGLAYAPVPPKHVNTYKFLHSKSNVDWDSKDKTVKKLKSQIYLRTRSVSTVLASWITQDYLNEHLINKELWNDMNHMAWKASIRLKHGQQNYLEKLMYLYKNCDRTTFSYIMNDLKKYNRTFIKFILDRYKPENGTYKDFIRQTPIYVKRCTHSLNMGNYPVELMNGVHDIYGTPSNKWQWYVLNTILHYRMEDSSHQNFIRGNQEGDRYEFSLAFLGALIKTDISVWHYYKKEMRIEKNYSCTKIHSILDTINDARLIYNNHHMNNMNIHFARIEGSAMNMLRNALYNHNQDREFNKVKKLDCKNFELPNPPIKLPEWIEAIRIKTAHDMIKAGIECEHCIGNYIHSNDIFVREKNICAQIDRIKLDIRQCYDIRDAITKESKSLQTRLLKALSSFTQKEIKHDKERTAVGAEVFQ